MIQILFLLCLLIFFLLWKRDIFNPAIITVLVWLVVTVAYEILPHNMNKLSDLFYFYMIFWVLSFSIGSIITSSIKFKNINVIKEKNVIKIKQIELFTIISLVVSLFLIFYVSKKTEYSLIGLTRNIGLNMKNVPVEVKIINFLTTIALPFAFYVFENGNKTRKFIVMSLYCSLAILSGSKSSLLAILVSIIFFLVYKRKFNRKFILKIILFLVIFISAILIVTFFRDKASSTKIDLIELIYIYFLSPLPAFDMLINGEININSTPPGSVIFGLLYRISNKFFQTPIPDSGLGFVFVPLPTNVYTVMSSGYLDFGTFGMFLFAFFYGLVWGFIYSYVRNGNNFFKLLYGISFYMLVFQFFADFLFPFLMIGIYQFLFSALIFTKFKNSYFLRYKL